MSNNQVPLNIVKQVLPVVDLDALTRRKVGVVDGGSVISYQEYLSSNVNNASLQITSQPPNGVIIDTKEFHVKMTTQLTFAGTSTGLNNLLQIGVADAPRDFPIHHSLSTATVNINNSSISTQPSLWFPALIRYKCMELDEFNHQYACPTQLDRCVDYSALFATNKSPFVVYGENSYEDPRGSYSDMTIVSNTPTSAVVNITSCEPLFLPGWYQNKAGLCNVSALNWNFTFGNLARSFWSHDSVNGSNITSITANITAFSMRFKFITPKITQSIPRNITLSYYDMVPYLQSNSQSVASLNSITLAMSSVNLQAYPKAIYIWVQKQESDLTYNDPDAFYRIDNINLVFNNVTGILASAKLQDLFKIAKRNGFNGSYNDYNKYCGAPLRLLAGIDFGCGSNEAPGLAGSPQLSLQVTATNLSSSSSTPKLFVFVQYEGALNIGVDNTTKSTSIISSMDVLNSEMRNAQKAHYKNDEDVFGGDLMQDIKTAAESMGKTILDGVQNMAKNTYNTGKVISDIFGRGVSGGDLIEIEAEGGKRRRSKKKGGVLIDREDLNQEY